MKNEKLLTKRGLPVTHTLSFRIPVVQLCHVKKLCEREGITLSKYTARLWARELEQHYET